MIYCCKISLYLCLIYFNFIGKSNGYLNVPPDSTIYYFFTNSDSEFRCANGDRISKASVCDEVKNCADGSDEETTVCRQVKSCLLPTYASNNISILNCNNSTLNNLNLLVEEFTLISVPPRLNDDSGDLKLICVHGKWFSTNRNYENLVKRIVEGRTCKGVPSKDHRVKGLYDESGRQVNANTHYLPGAVIYPQCEKGSYPKVKEAVCNENGSWSVDRFECISCEDIRDLKKLSLLVVSTSTVPETNTKCRAHVLSPYLVVTAGSCFDKWWQENYYVKIDGKTQNGEENLLKLIKIQKIYYPEGSQNENGNSLALAELEKRLTLDHSFGFICLDWKRKFRKNLEDFTNGAWSLATVSDEYEDSSDTNVYGHVDSCENSTFFLENHIGKNVACVNLGNKPLLMKKGAGFYVPLAVGYYIMKGIAIETSPQPSNMALFTGVTEYLDWMESIIDGTNRDPKIIKTTRLQTESVYSVINGAHDFDNFQITCFNGNTDKVFINGCALPEKHAHNIDYEVDCMQYEYRNYCQRGQTVHANGVPELAILKNITCNNGYTKSAKTNYSMCIAGIWYPSIPECNRVE